MEKTFEELIKHHSILLRKGDTHRVVPDDGVLKLMQQVREATIAEIENKANEYGEYGTADYVHEMPTDRIRIDLETDL